MKKLLTNKFVSTILSILISFLFVYAFATSTTTISSTGITATGSGSFATLNVTGTTTLATTTIIGDITGTIINSSSTAFNMFVGEGAGLSNTTGQRNFFGGYQAGYGKTTAGDMVFIGYQAGYGASDDAYSIGIGTGALYTGGGSENIAIGYHAGYLTNENAYDNVFIGKYSGESNTDGNQNTFINAGAGVSNTIGNDNVFMGYNTSWRNIAGSENTAIGNNAAADSRSASGLTAVGYKALELFNSQSGSIIAFADYGGGEVHVTSNLGDGNGLSGGESIVITGTTNYDNSYTVNTVVDDHSFTVTATWAGDDATGLWYRPDQGFNTAVGYEAGRGSGAPNLATAFGSYNSFLGYQAGYSVTTGSNNSFAGYQAGYSNTTGQHNLFMGKLAGYRNSTGNWNTILGSYEDSVTTYGNMDGGSNVLVGFNAGLKLTTGDSNTIVGQGSGVELTTGSYNVALGEYALGNGWGFPVTGNNNVAIGQEVLGQITTGSDNVSMGYYSGYSITGGSNNVLLGAYSGYSNINATGTVLIGYESGYNNTVSSSTFIGYQAGYSNTTGPKNTFFGYQAGYGNVDGNDNLFMGYKSGSTAGSAYKSVFLGAETGMSLTDGYGEEVYVGYRAGASSTVGWGNVYLGFQAGEFNQDGDTNTFIGNNAGRTNNGSSNIFIGSDTDIAGSNMLVIDSGGLSSTTALIYGEFDNDILVFNANVGIGTTSPYAKLSVVGETVSEYFTATSTTATSTLGNITVLGNTISSNLLSNIYINALSATSGNTSGAVLVFNGGNGFGSGAGGSPVLSGGNGGATGMGGTSSLYGGAGGATSGSGGHVELVGGDATTQGDGGDMYFWTGLGAGTGNPGRFVFYDPAQSYGSILDFSNVTSDALTYSVPDWSGNFIVSSSTSLYQAANGNIGIGTTSPLAALHVNSQDADSATAVATIIDTGSTWTTNGSRLLSVRNNGTEQMFVDETGNIIVGANTPGGFISDNGYVLQGYKNSSLGDPAYTGISIEYRSDANPSRFSFYNPYLDTDRANVYAGTSNPTINRNSYFDAWVESTAVGDSYLGLYESSAGTNSDFYVYTNSQIMDDHNYMKFSLNGADRLKLNPSVADGATAVAYELDTHNLLATAGAKLFSVQNQNTEKFSIDSSGTTTMAGVLKVTAANATSTISSNLHVQGTLRAAVSYVGDLIFANNFRFYEDPMPIEGETATGTQHLKLTNQRNEDIFSIDEDGNLTIKGQLVQATTTEESVLSLGLTWILDQFKTIGVTIADGIVSAQEFIGRSVKATEEFCLGSQCITESQFKELLEKNSIGSAVPPPAVVDSTSTTADTPAESATASSTDATFTEPTATTTSPEASLPVATEETGSTDSSTSVPQPETPTDTAQQSEEVAPAT